MRATLTVHIGLVELDDIAVVGQGNPEPRAEVGETWILGGDKVCSGGRFEVLSDGDDTWLW